MAKQIINYKPTNRKTAEGWRIIQPLLDREVLVDLPVCLVEFGVEYIEPVLVGETQNMAIVFEAESVRLKLKQQEQQEVNKEKGLRVFHLAKVNGEVKEVDESLATWSGDLPIDTDVTVLDIGANGDLTKTIKITEE